MAIKIIKDTDGKFRTVCHKCDCVLEYQLEDITEHLGWLSVLCPKCGTLISHKNRIHDDKNVINGEFNNVGR